MKTANAPTHRHTFLGKNTSYSGDHAHDLPETDAEIGELWYALGDANIRMAKLEARIAELEDTPVDPPPPPPVDPPPSGTAFLSRPTVQPIVRDGGQNFTLENVTIRGGSPTSPSGQGVIVRNVTGAIVIRDVDLADLQGGIYLYNCTGSLLIEGVRSRNIGTKTATNGDIGAGKSNHVQLAECSFTGAIRNNRFLGGRTEDMLSTWHSGGRGSGMELVIEGNALEGLVADTPEARAWDSASGTGIILSDGAGSTKNGWLIVRNNTILTPGQVGIQIIDGPGHQVYGNVVYGERRRQSNNPITSWEGAPTGVVRDNRYRWFREDGSEPAPWFHSGGAGLTVVGNVRDTALDPATLRVVL